ncbi:PREDICTED: uncharacterized protein LOC109150842 [Ipomoea nil]|uniref:uncharacterized protein LOC109150842 n=1 Tax=Ipomoea nil TaxID=35883 RepID=UPI000901BB09|nr:PREDICTED: uncharacterized protein LOC109150842 [Ipomoea nil]
MVIRFGPHLVVSLHLRCFLILRLWSRSLPHNMQRCKNLQKKTIGLLPPLHRVSSPLHRRIPQRSHRPQFPLLSLRLHRHRLLPPQKLSRPLVASPVSSAAAAPSPSIAMPPPSPSSTTATAILNFVWSITVDIIGIEQECDFEAFS